MIKCFCDKCGVETSQRDSEENRNYYHKNEGLCDKCFNTYIQRKRELEREHEEELKGLAKEFKQL